MLDKEKIYIKSNKIDIQDLVDKRVINILSWSDAKSKG